MYFCMCACVNMYLRYMRIILTRSFSLVHSPKLSPTAFISSAHPPTRCCPLTPNNSFCLSALLYNERLVRRTKMRKKGLFSFPLPQPPSRTTFFLPFFSLCVCMYFFLSAKYTLTFRRGSKEELYTRSYMYSTYIYILHVCALYAIYICSVLLLKAKLQQIFDLEKEELRCGRW